MRQARGVAQRLFALACSSAVQGKEEVMCNVAIK